MSIQKVRAYFEQFGIADRIREFDVSSATVDLAAVVNECVQDLQPAARKAYLVLSAQTEPVMVEGSRGLLMELCQNLCDNAIRCIGKYVYERGLTQKEELTISTKGGMKQLWLTVEDGKVARVKVDMGTPELNPRLIPVDLPGEIVLQHRLQIMGQTWFITCVNMGNPHAVLFVRDPEVIDLPTIGPMIEHHPLFPRRTNVEFVRVIDRGILQMRVWERGAGETLACGTGACASLVAAVLAGLADRTVQMKLSGGNLQLQWSAEDNHVYQTGPAAFVYDGEWLGD